MNVLIIVVLAVTFLLLGVMLAVLAFSSFYTAQAVTRIADVLQRHIGKK